VTDLQIQILTSLVKVIAVPLTLFTLVPVMVWVERRGSAVIQDRRGPNRAQVFGFTLFGFPHLAADAIKFFTKESFTPANASRLLYTLAPTMVLIPSIVAFAVIPFADDILLSTSASPLVGSLGADGALQLGGGLVIPMAVARLDGGLLFAFAVGSLGVLGIIVAGWSSGSKYPLISAVRTASQMVSYELILGLSALGIVVVYQSLEPNAIAQNQGTNFLDIIPKWGILIQPLAFVLFLVAGFAECNRNPFDLPESESELVAGYHTEYSGMKFSMFFMAEYIAMMTMSGLIVTLFIGGWQVPWFSTDALRTILFKILGSAQIAVLATAVCQLFWFALKSAFFLWLFVWVRWTLPRFRYDQLMDLSWKVLLPLGILNLTVTTFILGLLAFA